MEATHALDLLLAKLIDRTLTRSEETELYRLHKRYFFRRARVLDPSFFPGNEKSEAAIESLSNGAYASFANEPTHDGLPAFHYGVQRALSLSGFLYTWRASATIQYLRREGPELLRDRFKVLRNLRIHLREGFAKVGRRDDEDVYAPSCWEPRPLLRPDLERLDLLLEPDCGRGKTLLSAVFEAAGVPLTQSELAKILVRIYSVHALEEITLDERTVSGASTQLEATLFEREIVQRARAFVAALDAEERRLLVTRGYGEESRDKRTFRSFREVATLLDRYKEESYRLMERRVLSRFRDAFPELEEARVAARVLIHELAQPDINRDRSLER